MQVLGRIWIKENNKNFLGHGKVELLERIAKSGSIAKAAKEMHMSYKAAWDSIDAMNKLSKTPLVEKISGGKGGGGTRVTQKGLRFIELFRKMEEAAEELFNHFSRDIKALDAFCDNDCQGDFIENKEQIMIKTSARNTLKCEVVEVIPGAVNTEVKLKSGNLNLVSIITKESAQNLELKAGSAAFALIKSSFFIVFNKKPEGVSMRNIIGGKISKITQVAVNAEVLLDANGVELCAIVTKESVESLGLKVGNEAYFGVKASSVILAV
ncbi:MAG: TOBE domain-containing protein [Helicobacter sp.]|nr:TOBE domain-containing protein [Helicobacteraceae bacterium]MDY3113021.1 TOBE domain-containing protein [Helicobacter sp.]